jgi:diadenosine tetraphosphate (Ap4A) HIT family hydrolase
MRARLWQIVFMTSCIFCQIISRETPADILAENDAAIAFLSLEHHPLVVPKLHVPDLFGLSDVLGSALMRETVRIAKAVRTGLHCDGIYVTQANAKPPVSMSSISTCTSIRDGSRARPRGSI